MTKSPLDQQQFRAEGKANSAVVLNLGYTETNWEETLKKKKSMSKSQLKARRDSPGEYKIQPQLYVGWGALPNIWITDF